MSSKTDEIVLCASTADLPPEWLPDAGSVRLKEAGFFAVLERVRPHWQARSGAETDPAFKQWIPYILICNRRGELAAYPRRGSEARLHGLWSLGIGGHINPTDGQHGGVRPDPAWREWIWNGLRRELAEEYPSAAEGRTEFLGIIHESRTAVGRVHVGAVFLHRLDREPGAHGPELTGLRWLPRPQLGGDDWPLERFELWSQLALSLLNAALPCP